MIYFFNKSYQINSKLNSLGYIKIFYYYFFQVLSLGSIVPVFSEIYVTLSLLTADLVHLTLYGYLGIGIIVLTSLCISEPVSEKVVSMIYIYVYIIHPRKLQKVK